MEPGPGGHVMRAAWAPLVLATTACALAGPRADRAPRTEPTPRELRIPGVAAREPAVRVGVVVDSPALRLDGTTGLELVDQAGRVQARAGAGQAWTARHAADGIEARGASETVRVRGGLVVRPAGQGLVRVNGVAYRGSVLVIPGRSGVTAVNLLELETYLLGVVPIEIGRNRPAEELAAVKAQAVAARTYAIRHMGRRSELGFDLYGSVLDQAYGGADAEDPVSARAVRETRGVILVHRGQPIEAYYHSTCGGRTAAIEEVWPGEPRPYLRSVSDARPGGGWYCETSNRFRWTERWDRDELLATVSAGLRARLGRDPGIRAVRSMAITGRTRSGRARALRIRTDAGEHVIRGDSIRWVLRPQPGRILNSAAIELRTRGRRQVRELTVQGAGWGHGIGMCQVGAMGRARAGHTYRDILVAYYPGTEIGRLYP